MERPILDWLNELKEPYKSKAIANYNTPKAKAWRRRYGYKTAVLKSGAVHGAFYWAGTPEGYDYWCNYYYLLLEQDR